ncbi:MAG: hypothetical protein R3A79_01670 [Nannocystaceae bacterium]
MRRRALGLALLSAAVAPACACATASVARSVERTPPNLVFTRAIADDRPTDVLTAVSPADGRICLSGKWFDLPPTPQRYRYELRDGAGKVIHVGETEVTATAATWYTWSCYGRTPADAPGTWTYALRLGDAELEGSIEVAPRAQAAVLGTLSGDASALLGPSGDLQALAPNPAADELRVSLERCVAAHPEAPRPAAIALTVTRDGRLVDVRAEGEGPLARCLEEALAAVELGSTRDAPIELRVPLGGGGIGVRGEG